MRVVQKTRRVQYVEVQDGLMNPKDKYVTKRRSYNELNTKGYLPFVGTVCFILSPLTLETDRHLCTYDLYP